VTAHQPRTMTRFTALSQGVIFSLIVGVPLLRLAWDQWAQTLCGHGLVFHHGVGGGPYIAGAHI
jgi:hypothetical protein